MRPPQLGPAGLCVALLTVTAVAPAHSGVNIGGFTDISFFATDDDSVDVGSGFDEGQFVLHFSAALEERLSFFSELTWTPGNDEFRTEVERAIVKLGFVDAFKVSAGRYHTPVSWWNSAYHHGTWLQTSVDRPLAARFGSRYLPIHFVGAMAEGSFFPGAFTLGYAAGVGNGRGENVARAGDAGDVNNHRATIVQLGLRHDSLYELQIGGALYLDRFPIENEPDVDERTLSAYVVFSRETPEILAEFFDVRHRDDLTGIDTDNTSYYVQLAYRLPWFRQVLKPYARVEEIDVDSRDRGFDGVLGDLERALIGVRYDFASVAALKVEGRRVKENHGERNNEIYASLNVAF